MKKVSTRPSYLTGESSWFDSSDQTWAICFLQRRIIRLVVFPIHFLIAIGFFWRLFQDLLRLIVRSETDRSTCPKKKVFEDPQNRSNMRKNLLHIGHQIIYTRRLLYRQWSQYFLRSAFFSTILAMSSSNPSLAVFTLGRTILVKPRFLQGHPWSCHLLKQIHGRNGNPIFIESCFCPKFLIRGDIWTAVYL